MECKYCSENLTAYLDGELSPEDSAQIQIHTKSCSACADELQSLQHAADFVEAHTSELELRLGSWNRLKTQISVPKSRAFWGLPFAIRWRTVMAAAVCIAAFALGFIWYQQAQRNSLDDYIAQYEKAREAGRTFRRAVAGVDTAFTTNKLAIDNPFVEAKASLDLNPFRSEDR